MKDKHYIESILTRPVSSLRDSVERLVVQGVEDEQVIYNEFAGLAVVRKLDGQALVSVMNFERWWASNESAPHRGSKEALTWRREYWEALRTYPSELLLRLIRQYNDWFGSDSSRTVDPQQWLPWHNAYRDASSAWSKARQQQEDLDFALRLGDAQEVALRALGIELQDLGVSRWTVTYRLSDDFALARTGKVSAPVAARVATLLDEEIRQATGVRTPSVPIWFTALVMQFQAGMWLQPWSGESAAEFLLSILKASVPELHPRMAHPSSTALTRANNFLSTCRVNSIKPEAQPRGSKGGPPRTPWSAAVAFAECFGISGIPGERDAKR